jgi:hypothetical protein
MGAVITGEGVIVGTGVATGVAGWLHPQTINERKMSAASINRLIRVKWESRGINVVNFLLCCVHAGILDMGTQCGNGGNKK